MHENKVFKFNEDEINKMRLNTKFRPHKPGFKTPKVKFANKNYTLLNNGADIVTTSKS